MQIYKDDMLGNMIYDFGILTFKVGTIRGRNVNCRVDTYAWPLTYTHPLIKQIKRNMYHILANEEAIRLFAAAEHADMLKQDEDENDPEEHDNNAEENEIDESEIGRLKKRQAIDITTFASLMYIDHIRSYDTNETFIFFDVEALFPYERTICIKIDAQNKLHFAVNMDD